MKKRKSPVPRAVLKNLADDIKKMIGSREGKIFLLETVEEIPFETRSHVLEGLSSFYTPQMVDFFHLLKAEYGKEMEPLCARTLEKYRLAGMDVLTRIPSSNRFYKAHASCSRHTGRMTVDVAWQLESGALQVECFYLTFNPDGIHSFFLIENMPVKQYESDRQLLPDMVEITLAETCFIVAQAYAFNINNMTRPALGRFLYQKYLDYPVCMSDSEGLELVNRLSQKISPAQVVNSFFHALKFLDLDFIACLTPRPSCSRHLLDKNFEELLKPGSAMLEGQIDQVYGSRNSVWVQAYCTTVSEAQFYRHSYVFNLQRSQGGDWLIADIRHENREILNAASDSGQHLEKIHYRMYDILDLDRLFDILDRIENIYEVEELPCGMHMRVNCADDSLNQGVSFLSGVVADLVINGEELVLLSPRSNALKDFEMLLGHGGDSPVCFRGESKIGLLTAYNFLRGRYVEFAEALDEGEFESGLDEGMRFISTRYIIKDRENVIRRIEEIESYHFKLAGDVQVYYEFDPTPEGRGFFAEYIVGANWLTLSTFGERDMGLARKSFEKHMFDYLEMDGMEIREEGVFDILSAEVKKEHPELEGFLKEAYLNKWSESRLAVLSGMTPSEACQTEEGSRMLWSLLKRMQGKSSKRRRQGRKRHVHLHEYIHKLQQKMNEGINHSY